jgi:hypothetical protein
VITSTFFFDQPDGWFGPKVKLDWPSLVNLRLDPFELTTDPKNTPPALLEFYGHNFWRFVYVQREVAKLAATAIEFPPMQKPASFNLEGVKAKIEETVAAHTASK